MSPQPALLALVMSAKGMVQQAPGPSITPIVSRQSLLCQPWNLASFGAKGIPVGKKSPDPSELRESLLKILGFNGLGFMGVGFRVDPLDQRGSNIKLEGKGLRFRFHVIMKGFSFLCAKAPRILIL